MGKEGGLPFMCYWGAQKVLLAQEQGSSVTAFTQVAPHLATDCVPEVHSQVHWLETWTAVSLSSQFQLSRVGATFQTSLPFSLLRLPFHFPSR